MSLMSIRHRISSPNSWGHDCFEGNCDPPNGHKATSRAAAKWTASILNQTQKEKHYVF